MRESMGLELVGPPTVRWLQHRGGAVDGAEDVANMDVRRTQMARIGHEWPRLATNGHRRTSKTALSGRDRVTDTKELGGIQAVRQGVVMHIGGLAADMEVIRFQGPGDAGCRGGCGVNGGCGV